MSFMIFLFSIPNHNKALFTKDVQDNWDIEKKGENEKNEEKLFQNPLKYQTSFINIFRLCKTSLKFKQKHQNQKFAMF